MKRDRYAGLILSLLIATTLDAQQLDLFDPDDFAEPRLTRGRIVFISRFVAGVSRGLTDQYRPFGQDVAVVHVANSLYWSGLQLDYKRSETFGEREPEEDVNRSLITTLQSGDPGPALEPIPGPKNVTQLSWYQAAGERLTFRVRAVYATQLALRETAANVRGLDDRDETRMLQVDAGRRAGGRSRFLTLTYTELTRHGTVDKTKQRTMTAATFLPIVRIGPGLLTPRIQVGAVTGEGPAIDIVNASLDWWMEIPRVEANVHVVYSPVYRDIGGGRKVHHQLGIFADRELLMLVIRGRRSKAK